jgi:hypothetical protein
MQIRRYLPYFRYLGAALFTTRAIRQILLSINRDRNLTVIFAEKGEILSMKQRRSFFGVCKSIILSIAVALVSGGDINLIFSLIISICLGSRNSSSQVATNSRLAICNVLLVLALGVETLPAIFHHHQVMIMIMA